MSQDKAWYEKLLDTGAKVYDSYTEKEAAEASQKEAESIAKAAAAAERQTLAATQNDARVDAPDSNAIPPSQINPFAGQNGAMLGLGLAGVLVVALLIKRR